MNLWEHLDHVKVGVRVDLCFNHLCLVPFSQLTEKQTLELRHSYNSYGDALRVLTIGKPAVNMATDFVIVIS